MPSYVQRSSRGDVILLQFDNGPVNALSIANGFVDELANAVREAQADPSCDAIVISGSGRMFCGGADIADFDRDPSECGKLRDLMAAVEQCPLPVVMALHGHVLGGGLELALAGHFRILAPDAVLGLPEVTLGLLPGAGGTQRLPRLIGASAALEMMLSGKSVSAVRAVELGLADELAEGDMIAAALAFAARSDLVPRRTGMMPVPKELHAVVEAARAKLDSMAFDKAPTAIVTALASVTEDLAQGLADEEFLFGALLSSPASKGLRHAFLSERKVARLPADVTPVGPRPIDTIGVVGAGLMGTGITISLLSAGLPVTLVEARPDALRAAVRRIEAAIEKDIDRGRISRSEGEARKAALVPATTMAALADVDLAIEAVYEDMSAKVDVLAALDGVVKPRAILASNTSTLDLNLLAASTSDASRVVGLHFFSPANIMRLLEIVRGSETAPDVLATATSLSRHLGKVGVVSGVCDGFIGNRIFEEYLRQVWFMLEEGALPRQVDEAMERWGMAMGPCRTMDLVGQDIGWAIRRRRAEEQPQRPYSRVIDLICELGRFGQKTEKGIYAYSDGRNAEDDPLVEEIILSHSRDIGLERRTIPDDEIVDRCLLAMINEGAKIVGEGIAYRPLDVDMTLLHGYGFPRVRGGPMFQADLGDLAAIVGRLRGYQAGRHGWAWTPAPLLLDLAARGGRLEELNQ